MYGIFSYSGNTPRVGYNVGGRILDLAVAQRQGLFGEIDLPTGIFERSTLNDFIALGKAIWLPVDQQISELIRERTDRQLPEESLFVAFDAAVQLHSPIRIGDYTDFYAGIHHAENVGRMFRPNGDPLLPNYRHMPVAYHGRASSIVVSGTPIKRPNGQFLRDDAVVFGPTQALDFELELGLIIGKNSALGEPVPIDRAEDYIFGVVLFNDWSARDIQRWEYQPLGPFLGKNFGSSMSAWVLPFHKLEPFRIAGPAQSPAPLPYLQTSTPGHFDINLEVRLNGVLISQSNARHLYWNFAQMIAHHTVNGCNLTVGDVLATGTISGPTPDSCGSLLELTRNGTQSLTLSDGTVSTFLKDGDTVTMRGWAETNGQRVNLGDVSGGIVGQL
ncbi:MAG: fumarylacetoacetase [Bacteroidetes bacterium]|nr:fumarylacetoacetase [Fibrella sp.]